MQIMSEKKIIVLEIGYDNTSESPKDEILKYLDGRFSETGYRIKRSGQKPGCNDIGLMIVHADIDSGI